MAEKINGLYQKLNTPFGRDYDNYWGHLSRLTGLLIILNISLFFMTELVTRYKLLHLLFSDLFGFGLYRSAFTIGPFKSSMVLFDISDFRIHWHLFSGCQYLVLGGNQLKLQPNLPTRSSLMSNESE
jgi:hypothetical protein